MKRYLFYILLAIAFWGIGYIIGFLLGDVDMGASMLWSDGGAGQKITVFGILANNVKVVFFNFTGLASIGISSMLSLLVNGFVLGMFMKYASTMTDIRSLFMQRILPHLFFELFGIWLSGMVGLMGVDLFLFRLFNKEKHIDDKLILFMVVSVVLIIVGAVVEVKVSFLGVGKWGG